MVIFCGPGCWLPLPHSFFIFLLTVFYSSLHLGFFYHLLSVPVSKWEFVCHMNEMKKSNLQSLFSSIASLTSTNNNVDTHTFLLPFSHTDPPQGVDVMHVSEWMSVTIVRAKGSSHLIPVLNLQCTSFITNLTFPERGPYRLDSEQQPIDRYHPIIPNTVNYTSESENPSSGHCKCPLIAFTWQLSQAENILVAASKLNHALSVL